MSLYMYNQCSILELVSVLVALQNETHTHTACAKICQIQVHLNQSLRTV